MKLADILPIGVLALLVWVFFYLVGMRLDGPATGAVVVFCAVAVFAFKWIRTRLTKEGQKGGGKLKSERRAAALLLFGLTLLATVSQPAPPVQAAQGSPPSEALFVMCSADRLFVEESGPVALRAYTQPKDDGSLRYTWTVTAGRIEGTGAQVQWQLAGTAPGIYQLALQVADPQGRSATTQVQIVVIKPLGVKGGRYTTGRAFLVQGKTEEAGYGLYSYVLLGSRPTDEPTRARYLSTITAYLRLSDVVDLLEALNDKQQINITYIPVKTAPGTDILSKLKDPDEKKYAEVAAWVLREYHFERAEALLKKLDGDHLDGPSFPSGPRWAEAPWHRRTSTRINPWSRPA